MGANEPHAYLFGDCAEVMATSDNVVRAGLTPKWKDVETLCAMLTYHDGPPHVVTPTQPDGEAHVWRYSPPADEFALDRVVLGDGEQATLGSEPGLSILLVVSGSVVVDVVADKGGGEWTPDAHSHRTFLSAGAIHLVCPSTILQLTAQGGGAPQALIFRATTAAAPPTTPSAS